MSLGPTLGIQGPHFSICSTWPLWARSAWPLWALSFAMVSSPAPPLRRGSDIRGPFSMHRNGQWSPDGALWHLVVQDVAPSMAHHAGSRPASQSLPQCDVLSTAVGQCAIQRMEPLPSAKDCHHLIRIRHHTRS